MMTQAIGSNVQLIAILRCRSNNWVHDTSRVEEHIDPLNLGKVFPSKLFNAF